MRVRFQLKDLLYWFVILAVLLGWYVDRKKLNEEAASLTVELYKFKSRLVASTLNYSAFFPPRMQSQYLEIGDVLDPHTRNGRERIANRLTDGDLNFRIVDPSGDLVSGIDGPGWEMETLEAFKHMNYDEQSRNTNAQYGVDGREDGKP